MKFPRKGKWHDLSSSMRGQGKRTGGMIRGAMAARTGKSFEIDVQATFGLNDEDAEDVRLLGFFDFGLYYRLRELEDKSHAEAMRIIDDALDEIEAEK